MTQEQDIESFLSGLLEKIEDVDSETKRMFKLLVTVTLRFNDELKANEENLTVLDTQRALDAFMDVMKTHKMPENLSEHSHKLLVKWLEEIKQQVHH